MRLPSPYVGTGQVLLSPNAGLAALREKVASFSPLPSASPAQHELYTVRKKSAQLTASPASSHFHTNSVHLDPKAAEGGSAFLEHHLPHRTEVTNQGRASSPPDTQTFLPLFCSPLSFLSPPLFLPSHSHCQHSAAPAGLSPTTLGILWPCWKGKAVLHHTALEMLGHIPLPGLAPFFLSPYSTCPHPQQ